MHSLHTIAGPKHQGTIFGQPHKNATLHFASVWVFSCLVIKIELYVLPFQSLQFINGPKKSREPFIAKHLQIVKKPTVIMSLICGTLKSLTPVPHSASNDDAGHTMRSPIAAVNSSLDVLMFNPMPMIIVSTRPPSQGSAFARMPPIL